MEESLEQFGGLFITNAEASEVLEPRDRAFDFPPPLVSPESSPVLRDGVGPAIGAVRRDQVSALRSQFIIELVAVVRLVADDAIRRDAGEHEVEQGLHQLAFMRRCGAGVDRPGTPRASTNTMIFTPFPAFVTPIPSPPPLALLNVASMKHS